MSRAEAIALLFCAKYVLADLGQTDAAGVAEDEENRLRDGVSREDLAEIASSLVKPGKRGRIFKVLYPPQYVRAVCFIAAVLRAVDD